MTSRETALQSAATLLRPLASFMIKCGLTWREFAALAKTAFVASATDEYGIKGRPTNASRVALLCGLSRKEVRRQRDLFADPIASTSEVKTTDATQVLSAWHQDPAYLDNKGRPIPLTRESFEALSRRHCQEMTSSGLIKELIRVGAVAETDNGKLEVRQRYYMPSNTDVKWKLTAGHYIADLTQTISHNIDLDKSKRTRFLGRATEAHVSPDVADDFREFLEQEGQAFLERIDTWLTDRQLPKESPHNSIRLGVGVFQIQSSPPTDQSTDREQT